MINVIGYDSVTWPEGENMKTLGECKDENQTNCCQCRDTGHF